MTFFDVKKMIKSLEQHKRLLFICFNIVFIIAYYFLQFDGLIGYDDYDYLKLSNDFFQETKNYVETHFAYRIGLTFPVAVITYFLGMNDYTIGLFPLLCSLATYFLLEKKIRYLSNIPYFIVLTLYTFNVYILFYSNKTYPDVVMMFYVFASFWFLHTLRSFSFPSFRKIHLYSFLIVAMMFLAMMTKLLVIHILPIFSLFLIFDFSTKSHLKMWKFIFMYTILFLVAYFFITYQMTGTPWMRFDLILDNQYLNHCSYNHYPELMFKRLTTSPVMMFVSCGFLSVVCFGVNLSFKFYRLEKDNIFWTTTAFFLFFSWWYLPTFPTAYVPTCIEPRQFLFVVPFLLISLGYLFENQIYNNKTPWQVIVRTSLFLLLTYFFAYQNIRYKYILIIIGIITLVGTCYFTYRSLKILGILLLVSGAMLQPLYSILKPSVSGSKEEVIMFKRHFTEVSEPTILMTHPRLSNCILYYQGFEENKNLKVVSFQDTLFDKKKKLYLLENKKDIASSLNDSIRKKIIEIDKYSSVILYKYP